MRIDLYISPFVEVIGLDATGVLASSPYGIEGITPYGEVIEWDWAD